MGRSQGQERFLFGPDARILILLLQKGECKRSDFQVLYNFNHFTAVSSLTYLRDLGLCECEDRRGRKLFQVWFLTEKGKIVADMVAEIIKITVNETIEQPNRK